MDYLRTRDFEEEEEEEGEDLHFSSQSETGSWRSVMRVLMFL
jgi:hypothetical protein